MRKRTIRLIAIAGILSVAVLAIRFMPKILSGLSFLVWILMPFVSAYAVSFLGNSMATGLQKRFKLPRGISAVLVIILIVGIIGSILAGIVWKIVDEIKLFYDSFRWATLDNAFNTMPKAARDLLYELYKRFMDSVATLSKNTEFLKTAGSVAKKVPNVLISSITFILSLYFMISDFDRINSAIRNKISPGIYNRAKQLGSELKRYFGGYFKAQMIIMCIAFAIILTGLLIMRIDYALLIALAVAVFDAIPFFGSGAVFIPWAIIAFFAGNIKNGIGILIVYLSVQMMRQILEPKIVGKNIGMHPLLTLFSMYAGYKIFSIGGIILGPCVMMLIISFYKIGVFDNFIKFIKAVLNKIKKEYTEFTDNEGE